MKQVKLVVIGNGNLGKWHCEKANKIAEIDFVGMVDISAEAQNRFKNIYSEIPVFFSIDDVLDKIDAAIIVTPISTHYELSKKLIQNGKHVFCEKSAAETGTQINDIDKLLKKTDLVFQVGHSERYHQVWSELDQYSRTLSVEQSVVHINRFGPFRGRDADVSVVEDLLIHDVDLLLHLFKEIPSKVRAVGFKIRSTRWDHVQVTFTYKSGRVATVSTGRNHVRVVRDFEIINDTGCLYVDLLNNQLAYARNDSSLEEVSIKKSYPKRDHLYFEQIDFVNSIINKKPAVIGIEDAKNAINVLDKVLLSLDSGKEVKI